MDGKSLKFEVFRSLSKSFEVFRSLHFSSFLFISVHFRLCLQRTPIKHQKTGVPRIVRM